MWKKEPPQLYFNRDIREWGLLVINIGPPLKTMLYSTMENTRTSYSKAEVYGIFRASKHTA
jgi:hypothetical protein